MPAHKRCQYQYQPSVVGVPRGVGPGTGRQRPGRAHTGQMEPGPDSLAEYFDGWHAGMTGSPVKDENQQRHLGLPPHLLSVTTAW
jgi:hypothetical protein